MCSHTHTKADRERLCLDGAASFLKFWYLPALSRAACTMLRLHILFSHPPPSVFLPVSPQLVASCVGSQALHYLPLCNSLAHPWPASSVATHAEARLCVLLAWHCQKTDCLRKIDFSPKNKSFRFFYENLQK